MVVVCIMVRMLAFYSDNPSLNPNEIYSFYSITCWNKNENKRKERSEMAHLKQLFKFYLGS